MGLLHHPSSALEEGKKVIDLINFNQYSWREERVRHLFLHHEAKAILQIPLNPAWPEDKLTWNYTLNGKHTVKSGYKVVVDFAKSSILFEGP